MGKKEKLLKRLLSRPSDFTYEEAKTLLQRLGYIECNKGKTSGSRVLYKSGATGHRIMLHKPHPQNTLPDYAIDDLIEELSGVGLIVK